MTVFVATAIWRDGGDSEVSVVGVFKTKPTDAHVRQLVVESLIHDAMSEEGTPFEQAKKEANDDVDNMYEIEVFEKEIE